jgi:S-adenosylmethionine:tRNA ribosyltransferase-isomerase
LLQQSHKQRNLEVLFVGPAANGRWEVLCKPGRRIRAGDHIVIEGVLQGVFEAVDNSGLWRLHVDSPEPLETVLEKYGHVPLPPYIDRPATVGDLLEYQTVYAQSPGAIAAPTAGLHFSDDMFEMLRRHGTQIEMITLHVGVGTFMPVRADDPREHSLRPEHFEITPETASHLNEARALGRRIVAVGTTTTRTLEHSISKRGLFHAEKGEADLLILPGHTFRAVGAILTNFHLPRTTLLMLVSAFATRELILEAYRRAVELKYRFYSYGDCMLVL